MAFEPAADTHPDDIPGYRTTFSDILSGGERALRVAVVLAALRELIRWFQDRADQER
jgi:hypothetical protein